MTTEDGLGHSAMAYTTAVLPGGFGQKDVREVDQFLYEKDTSSVCGIFVKMGLLWSVVSRSYCMLVPVHV